MLLQAVATHIDGRAGGDSSSRGMKAGLAIELLSPHTITCTP